MNVVDDGNPPKDVKVLELATLKLYGSDVYALMDSGAIPNVVSPQLCERLGLNPERSARRISTATGEKFNQLGILRALPVAL